MSVVYDFLCFDIQLFVYVSISYINRYLLHNKIFLFLFCFVCRKYECSRSILEEYREILKLDNKVTALEIVANNPPDMQVFVEALHVKFSDSSVFLINFVLGISDDPESKLRTCAVSVFGIHLWFRGCLSHLCT